MSTSDAEMPSSVRVTFKDVLSKSKRITFCLLSCSNVMSMINESVKCLWPLYASQQFNIHSSEIGWILFAFYCINICGLLLLSLLNKPTCAHLTSAPIFICLLSAIFIFFQANAIKKGDQTTSFTQVFILLLCLGFVSYHSLHVITIAFCDTVLPRKRALIWKQDIMSPTHLLFTSIGPTLAGFVLYAFNDDYYSVFYILSIAALVLTVLSLLLCGKQHKLQSLQTTVKYNDDEHTKLNGNHDLLHEREFPANINIEELVLDDSDSNACSGLLDVSSVAFTLSSFWCNAALQIMLNWYIYFMHEKYAAAPWVSGLQLSITGICAVFSVFVVNRFNYYRYEHLFQVSHRMYHVLHITILFIFGIASYFLSYVDHHEIFWYVAIPAGLLIGILYQYNYVAFWKRMKLHTDRKKMQIYYMVLFASNIGAALGNLACGMLVDHETWWFWRIIAICFMMAMITAMSVYIVCCILRLDEQDGYTALSNKTAKSAAAEQNIAEDFMSSQMSPPLAAGNAHSRWSEDEKWKEDDIVGDLHIAQMRKNLHKKVGSARSSIVSNSLGLLDVDYLPDLMKQHSGNTDVSDNNDSSSVVITPPRNQ